MALAKSHGDIPHLLLRRDAEEVDFAIKTMLDIKRADGEAKEPPHRHDFYTILWARKVSGEHMVDFQTFRFQPHTLYFISPEQVHQVHTQGEPDGLALLFSQDFLQRHHIGLGFFDQLELFSNCEEYFPLAASQQEGEELDKLLGQLMEEYAKPPYPWQAEALAALLKLFLIACRRVKERNGVILSAQEHGQQRIVRSFRDLVELHYKAWHMVSRYAEELAITANYLNEVMKSETGTSAKEYIQKRLVAEAKRQAIYTDRSSKEIAFDLGFEDPSHFSKFFKRCQGESFSSFRKQIEEKYH